jgi:hypothetical protein
MQGSVYPLPLESIAGSRGFAPQRREGRKERQKREGEGGFSQ